MNLQLSEPQLDVMQVLWQSGEATVAQVHALLDHRGWAATTVATLLKRLEKRGLVRHRTEGRQFVYEAAVSADEVRQSMVGGLRRSLFANDAASFVCHLLSEEDITPGDAARIRALLDQAAASPEAPAPESDDAR